MPVLPKSTPPGASTGTLELKATKENAHRKSITSVAFNPVDGKTIVSVSRDKTIKVWGFRPVVESEWEVDIEKCALGFVRHFARAKERHNGGRGWGFMQGVCLHQMGAVLGRYFRVSTIL